MRVFPALALDQSAYARRTFCSWHDAGWRSVLLRRFDDAPVAEDVQLPPTPDQHLVLVTAGTSWIESRTDRGWHGARYAPGQIGLTAPDRPTRLRWRSAEGTSTLHLYLPGDLMRRVGLELWGNEEQPPQADALAVEDPLVEQVLLALSTAAASGIDDLYAEGAAEFLAVHLQTRHGGRPAVTVPRHEDARVRRAIEMMRDNLHAPLTLADIAGEVWLSVYHFLRVFKAATGQTPRRYLTGLRVEAARRQLEEGTASISEIAQRCGFSSPAHLAAAFARATGMSPSAYRRATNR